MKKYQHYGLSSFLIIFIGLISSTLAASENQVDSLLHYSVPADLENVKVIKLSSDKHSSNYLIYIKKSVSPHRHLSHSESIYVISGEGVFTLADTTMKIAAGDFINVPEGVVHAVEVTSKEPLKVLSNQAPEFLGKDRVYVK